MAGFPLLTFCRGFSSCCRAILLTPMEYDRSPPPCCASPRIGRAGDAAFRMGEAEGTPPSCPADRPPASLPVRTGGAAASLRPRRSGTPSLRFVTADLFCSPKAPSPPRSRASPHRSARSPLAERAERGGSGHLLFFLQFKATSQPVSSCSSCPAGGEVMSAGRALPSWHCAGLKGTAAAPAAGPRAAAAAHRRAGAELLRLSVERAAIKPSVWDE